MCLGWKRLVRVTIQCLRMTLLAASYLSGEHCLSSFVFKDTNLPKRDILSELDWYLDGTYGYYFTQA
jgi:hypothetical protein